MNRNFLVKTVHIVRKFVCFLVGNEKNTENFQKTLANKNEVC